MSQRGSYSPRPLKKGKHSTVKKWTVRKKVKQHIPEYIMQDVIDTFEFFDCDKVG
jgi:hypothetical protein